MLVLHMLLKSTRVWNMSVLDHLNEANVPDKFAHWTGNGNAYHNTASSVEGAFLLVPNLIILIATISTHCDCSCIVKFMNFWQISCTGGYIFGTERNPMCTVTAALANACRTTLRKRNLFHCRSTTETATANWNRSLSSRYIQRTRPSCLRCSRILRRRDTSFVLLLFLGLNSQMRATRSHSWPSAVLSRSSMKAASAFLPHRWPIKWHTKTNRTES